METTNTIEDTNSTSILLAGNGLIIGILDVSLAVKVASFMCHSICAMPWNPRYQLPDVGTIYKA